MKIRVLGCSGAEFPGHNPPGFLLNDEILFDAGSLTNVLNVKGQVRIRNIFITHAHLDHIRGIPFLADNLILDNHRHKVTVMSIAPVIKAVRQHLLNGYVWPDFTIIPDPKNGVLEFVKLHEGRSVCLNGFTVTPYRVNHSVPAVGYLVEDMEERRFFYSGDTGPTSETWKRLGSKHINAMIIEVSFPNSMEQTALRTGHLTARLLQKELSKMYGIPERILITHTKPQYSEAIRREIRSLPLRNSRLLRDGEIIRIR